MNGIELPKDMTANQDGRIQALFLWPLHVKTSDPQILHKSPFLSCGNGSHTHVVNLESGLDVTRNLHLAAFTVTQTLVSTFKSQYRVEIQVLQHSQQPSTEEELFQPNVLSPI